MSLAEIGNHYSPQTSYIKREIKTAGAVTPPSDQTYSSTSEYAAYLQKKFPYFGKSALVAGVPTTVSVSGSFLQQGLSDPEKAQYLESNLKAIHESVSYVQNHSLGTLVNASYQIDAEGNTSMASISTNDPDGKIAEENAKKKKKAIQERQEKQEELAEKIAKERKLSREKLQQRIREKAEAAVDSEPKEPRSQTILSYSHPNEESKSSLILNLTA